VSQQGIALRDILKEVVKMGKPTADELKKRWQMSGWNVGCLSSCSGLLTKLVGGFTFDAVKGTLEGVGELAKDIRSAITGEINPDKKAELLEKTQQLEALARQGQQAVNKAEAQHRSVFVAGWRPFIGWVCGIGLGAYFIPQYIMATVLWVRVCWAAQQIMPYPIPEPKGLLTLLTGMLGLGILRTIEKGMGKTV